jgi:hypothetical protein
MPPSTWEMTVVPVVTDAVADVTAWAEGDPRRFAAVTSAEALVVAAAVGVWRLAAVTLADDAVVACAEALKNVAAVTNADALVTA